jgi:hypothetical protein
MRPIDLIKTHQQKIALVIGYCLMAGLAFGLGRISATSQAAPEIKVEEAFVPLNNTSEPAGNQSQNGSNPQPTPNPAPTTSVGGTTDCAGKIKGNISGSSKVYHKPGGSSYNRTKPEACFNTEAEALAAGFRAAAN